MSLLDDANGLVGNAVADAQDVMTGCDVGIEVKRFRVFAGRLVLICDERLNELALNVHQVDCDDFSLKQLIRKRGFEGNRIWVNKNCAV